jgi:hypothetical protein
MCLARFAAFALAAMACGPSVVVASNWSADTGIYGTYDHFGNPPNGPATFICGVGYDMRFRGGLPLDSVEVAVRYPEAFKTRIGDQPNLGGPDGWVTGQPIIFTSSAHPTPPRPEALGHVSGTIGTICPGGAADLDALRGTTLRLRWRDHRVDQEEMFVIDRVRGNLTVFADQLSDDGLPRLEWDR